MKTILVILIPFLAVLNISLSQAHDIPSLGYASMKTKMSKEVCKQRAYAAIASDFRGGQINPHKHGVAYSDPTIRIEVLCTTSGGGLVNYVAMVSYASDQTKAFLIAGDIVKGIRLGVFE